MYAIRTFGSVEMELALAVDVSEDQLAVWPVSEEPLLATDADLVLPAPVLGFAASLHPALAGVVLPEQLDDAVGRVSGAERAAAEAGAPVVSDDDPRLIARAGFAERWPAYFEPAAMFDSTLTLGELIAKGRTLRQVSVADVAQHVRMNADLVSRLEADDIDLIGEVPPSILADVLRRLAVMPSRKLATRVRQAVIATTSTGTAHAPAYRRSAGSAPAPDRGRAEDYAASVMLSLTPVVDRRRDASSAS